MIHVLFICHGNICRSPMAEYLFRDMVEKRGLSAQFHIASAATSREEIGNGVYPPAKRKLASVGISCNMHHARQVTKEDYAAYDYLLVAERYNIPNLMRTLTIRFIVCWISAVAPEILPTLGIPVILISHIMTL